MGGSQPPPTVPDDDICEPRSHDLTDAICIPGIISNPQAVPGYSTDHIELRDRERTQYLSLGPSGITITDGKAVWNMHDGKVTLDAPSGIEETSKSTISQRTTGIQTIEGSNIEVGTPDGVSSGVDYIENTLKSRIGTFIDRDGVNLNTHNHTGVESGPENTGAPVDGGSTDLEEPAFIPDYFAVLEEEYQEAHKDVLATASNADQLLMCIPNIAEVIATNSSSENDAIGWQQLSSYIQRWLYTPSNTNAKDDVNPEWVNLSWVLSYERAAVEYSFFTHKSYETEPSNIYNEASKSSLTKILLREQCFSSQKVYFDFTTTDWKDWDRLYHTHRATPPRGETDGLQATLGTYTMRALAKGWTEPNQNGTYKVVVTGCSVYVYDVFNFDAGGIEFLAHWDCQKSTVTIRGPKKNRVTNGLFRDYRNRHKYGHDFLVLSTPRNVDDFQEIEYVYP